VKILSKVEHVQWQVFSKHNKKSFHEKNVWIRPINNDEFIDSMSKADGVFCGAGFETPAEALFLKKKLMVIPMTGQYEQQCNAEALKNLGVPVIKSLKKKHLQKIVDWVSSGKVIPVNFPDMTEKILKDIIENETQDSTVIKPLKIKRSDFKLFRNSNFFKILEKTSFRLF
jgi:UDP:flavonoid glycosyltransferase YjiC (YdhE family)